MTKRRFPRSLRSALFIGVLAVAIGACDDDDDMGMNPNPNPNPNPDPMAEVCTASPATLVFVSNNGTANAVPSTCSTRR